MSGAELGLALVATIDLCFRHGSNLVRICSSAKTAEKEIAERVLRIESNWKRTRVQLELLQQVWQSLDDEHQSIQMQIIQLLVGKLALAVAKVDGVMVEPNKHVSVASQGPQKTNNIKRWKYALLKDRLDAAIEDLEVWQKLFDPSWFLIFMTSNSNIDTALTQQGFKTPTSSLLSSTWSFRNTLQSPGDPNKTIWVSKDGLKSAYISEIPMSCAKLAQRAGSSKLLILDSFHCPADSNQERIKRDVRKLARRLQEVDPISFGLLKCFGVVRDMNQEAGGLKSFTFAFEAVEKLLPPQSLRQKLLSHTTGHSLSDRLEIARDLAKSVSFVHTVGFVHKNMRPENILLAAKDSSSLGHSFLVGFHEFRDADGQTLRLGDTAWQRNLYRHPARQGFKPGEDYIMQHDIYSLGVCLLEIGLWDSFILCQNDGSFVGADILGPITNGLSGWQPDLIKQYLMSLAHTILPQRMGNKYAKVVTTCLTCLDEGNFDFGDIQEFQDEDGILVGVRYIDKILLQLDNISM